jgi:SAM-dependent methyltransferase
MTATDPYSADFFKTVLESSYPSAQRIVPLVLGVTSAHSVLDVGCGTGHFLKAFSESGIADLLGVDGTYVPRDQLVIPEQNFRTIDLAQRFDLGRQFDLVVSLEVAEHLPAASAATFIESLARHGSAILFSAAVPHQGGTGHVNEQWPSYWAQHFARLGFQAFDVFRPLLWHDVQVAWWYRQNILLFAKPEAAAQCPVLAERATGEIKTLDLVHPDLYAMRVQTLSDTSKVLEGLQRFLASAERFEAKRQPDGQIALKVLK